MKLSTSGKYADFFRFFLNKEDILCDECEREKCHSHENFMLQSTTSMQEMHNKAYFKGENLIEHFKI